MTSVGIGTKSPATYIGTCKCPKSIYTAWFENQPYTYLKSGEHIEGIFPKYLEEMVNALCAGCIGLKRNNISKPSTLYWYRSKNGRTTKRIDEKDLKHLVSNNVHMHVAMFGRSEIQNFQADYKFVSIIDSQGSAFIVRDPMAELDKTAAIMSSLASCWPAIIIILVLSILAGILVWMLDCTVNHEEFPNESFVKGIYHGTYWAFVSMTTVGYGDKTPQTVQAQIVAIAWMLMGPIINGIVVGAITTSLTTINLESDPIIYGTKTAALAGTFEYNLGVRRNAKMNSTDQNFTKPLQLITALDEKKVDGVLMDSLVAADLTDTITKKQMKISQIIPELSGWGIILSAEFLKLEEDIRSYVSVHAEGMAAVVRNKTNGKLAIKSKSPSSVNTGIVDPNSKTFKDFVYYGSLTIVILAIFGIIFEHCILRIRNRRIIPSTEEYKRLLQNDLGSLVTEFTSDIMKTIKGKSDHHDSEIKRFFWNKGYSFGIDGWFRQKTRDEELLKQKVRYDEIMSQDLGIYKPASRVISNLQK